ncbi:MAG: aspartate-semialdehyde dehydrogenase [Phycisphaeraceae bacterium]|nr:aspartate-semialdehyde dehydrogenase [Phycisphaeraceae bacterium]
MIPATSTVAIVGATGAVGREALAILRQRNHPPANIRAIASERSAGGTIEYSGAHLPIHTLSVAAFGGVNTSIFCTGAELSARWAREALNAGSHVVDNSSAFRLDPDVPLVIPEINGDLACPAGSPRLIANPNCSTILLLTALEPLRQRFGITRAVVSTYQAVSGAGAPAIDELISQTRAVLEGHPPRPAVFHTPCAFNVFSHDSAVDSLSGVNGEERKMIDETAKIWRDTSIPITPTCIRVPVVRAHSASVALTLSAPASEADLFNALHAGKGLCIIDNRNENHFPTPLQAVGSDRVLVGRIRLDPSMPRHDLGQSRHVCLWLCGDQLRKGAALNALQIADLLHADTRTGDHRSPHSFAHPSR